nr:MAG TPA: hypothetical protein [Caudoviricetes sp.]
MLFFTPPSCNATFNDDNINELVLQLLFKLMISSLDESLTLEPYFDEIKLITFLLQFTNSASTIDASSVMCVLIPSKLMFNILLLKSLNIAHFLYIS